MTTPGEQDLERLLLTTQSKPIDVYGPLLAILRSKGLILLSGLGCALICWLVLLRVPVTFRADVEILPPQITRGSNVAAVLTGTAGSEAVGALGSSMQGKTQSDVFVVILSAWPIQDALVKQFDLVNAYHARNATEARYKLASRTILKGSKDGFVVIGIVDTDRKRSAAIANAYVDQTREFLRGMALSEASQRRFFYEGQLVRIKEDLSQAEVAFQRMQQSSGMVALDSQTRTLLDSAAALRSQVAAKQVELQSLRSYSTASNPQVQIAQSELTALQGQLAQLESRGQGGYSGKALASVPGAELSFVRATRELKYEEGLYDLMVKQYEGSRIDEARDAPMIQVIEPALVPDHKFGPRRARDMRYAFGIGILLGIAFTLARHYLRQLSPDGRTRLTELRRAVLHW